jgi:4-amino-4-deoxy-L-arabinose transferase-like glycosyltransferase
MESGLLGPPHNRAAAAPAGEAMAGLDRRLILLLCLLSLIVRLGVFWPVARAQVPAVFDEVGYFAGATGWRDLFAAATHFVVPSHEAAGRAFQSGTWPPLHPALLGLCLWLLGSGETTARLMVVLVSAATTGLVYLLTLRLSSRRAAVAAAIGHVVYPPFVAYSHYLWSETTFIWFFLAAVVLTLRVAEAGEVRRRGRRALLAGACWGLAGLVRATVLPLLLVGGGWLAWSARPRERAVLPAVALAAALAVMAPWLSVLAINQHRAAPLSSAGEYNLYLGNNPWVPRGAGSSFADLESQAAMDGALRRYEEAHGATRSQAALALALAEIRGHPIRFLERCAERFRMLWAGDLFIARHLLHAVYPPLSGGVVAGISLLDTMAFVALIALAAVGLLAPAPALRARGLLLMLVGAGAVLPLVTVATTRFNLPSLALLLPAAGHGTLQIGRLPWRRRILAALIATGFGACAVTALPAALRVQLWPSSWYAGLFHSVMPRAAAQTRFTDRLEFRAPGEDKPRGIWVELQSEGYAFADDGTRRRYWDTADCPVMVVDVVSQGPGDFLEVRLVPSNPGSPVLIRPVCPESWRRWRTVGLAGVEFMWSGGGSPYSRPANSNGSCPSIDLRSPKRGLSYR